MYVNPYSSKIALSLPNVSVLARFGEETCLPKTKVIVGNRKGSDSMDIGEVTLALLRGYGVELRLLEVLAEKARLPTMAGTPTGPGASGPSARLSPAPRRPRTWT